MTADEREATGCLRRPKENENGKSQATENGVRTVAGGSGEGQLDVQGSAPNRDHPT